MAITGNTQDHSDRAGHALVCGIRQQPGSVAREHGIVSVPAHATANRSRSVVQFLAVLGPGLVVMFADTDAGSIITAAQSGALWGYRLLALQILLVPVLYLVQELAVRLGIITGRGHGELIREHFGPFWAWIAVSTLLVACFGALLSELSGIAGVGLLFGVPRWLTMLLAVTFLVVVVWSGSYHAVERVAVLLGGFELVFLLVAWHAHPDLGTIATQVRQVPLVDPRFLYLAAANVGAVIMPWMVFYQQSAVVEKGLQPKDLPAARWDTAWGAVLTQLVMAAVLIAAAATLGRQAVARPIDTVQQIAQALTPFLGAGTGRVLFALGMLGASLVAAIVVSLTAAWGLGEVLGFRRSLERHPHEAPWFYASYTLLLVLGGLVVAWGMNLVKLSIGVEVLNALLLPIVLGFLCALARVALPKEHRLHGGYGLLVGVVALAAIGFGLLAGGVVPLIGLLHQIAL